MTKEERAAERREERRDQLFFEQNIEMFRKVMGNEKLLKKCRELVDRYPKTKK